MHSQAPLLLQFPNPREIRYMLARSSYENVVSAIHDATVQHNQSNTLLLELVETTNRLEVFRHGLIFPSLTLLFDEGTAEMSFTTAPRAAGSRGEQGTVVPGYGGKALLVDKNAVAHRLTIAELAMRLLHSAVECAQCFERAA